MILTMVVGVDVKIRCLSQWNSIFDGVLEETFQVEALLEEYVGLNEKG